MAIREHRHETRIVIGNQPNEELISEPGTRSDLITTAAYITKPDGSIAQTARSPTARRYGRHARGILEPGADARRPQKPEITARAWASDRRPRSTWAVVPSAVVAPASTMGMQHCRQRTAPAWRRRTRQARWRYCCRDSVRCTPAFVKSHLTTNAIVDANTGAVWNKDWGHGKLRLGNLNVAVEPGTTASEFSFAVGPNPTQGPLGVEFIVARNAQINVGVFDLQGREVARLADGHHGPGRYHVGWSAAGARSGLYLVRYSGPGFSQVRRFVLTH